MIPSTTLQEFSYMIWGLTSTMKKPISMSREWSSKRHRRCLPRAVVDRVPKYLNSGLSYEHRTTYKPTDLELKRYGRCPSRTPRLDEFYTPWADPPMTVDTLTPMVGHLCTTTGRISSRVGLWWGWTTPTHTLDRTWRCRNGKHMRWFANA